MEQEQLRVVAGGEVDAWLDADDRAVYLLDVRTAENTPPGISPVLSTRREVSCKALINGSLPVVPDWY